MNVTAKQKVLFGLGVLRKVKVRRTKLYMNFAACVLIFVYGSMNGTAGEWVVGSIAFVQGVQVPDIIEAYWQAKQDHHIQYEEQEPPRKRQ